MINDWRELLLITDDSKIILPDVKQGHAAFTTMLLQLYLVSAITF